MSVHANNLEDQKNFRLGLSSCVQVLPLNNVNVDFAPNKLLRKNIWIIESHEKPESFQCGDKKPT